MNNNERYDLSNYLIHFFRDVQNISLEELPSFIENPQDFKNQAKDAFFFLTETIKHKLIPSTWAKRTNGNCVYGNIPAICFTEMPLSAFIESVEYRTKKKEKISIYGLIFKKIDLYQLGARPVIYGFAKGSGVNNFPEEEKFRYVSFQPFDKNQDIRDDFSHEREWRIPIPIIIDEDIEDDSEFYSNKKTAGAINSLPNLKIRNRYFKDVGIIVESEQDKVKVLEILMKTYKEKKKCPYTYILVKENILDKKKLRDFKESEIYIKQLKLDFCRTFLHK